MDEGLKFLRKPVIHDDGEGLFVAGKGGGKGSGFGAVAKELTLPAIDTEIRAFGMGSFSRGTREPLDRDLL